MHRKEIQKWLSKGPLHDSSIPHRGWSTPLGVHMTDESQEEIKVLWDEGLAGDEIHYIGKIVAHWGAIEHEIFCQTIQIFDDDQSDDIKLPKAMNNMKFSAVLELWHEKVVLLATEPKQSVLEKQYKKIKAYQDYRNALVHGMWDWKSDQPEVVTTTRIKNKTIVTNIFNEGDLYDFSNKLAQINFLIRYPGGLREALEEQMAQDFYINEAAFRKMAFENRKKK